MTDRARHQAAARDAGLCPVHGADIGIALLHYRAHPSDASGRAASLLGLAGQQLI
jgi:hypothetical protein